MKNITKIKFMEKKIRIDCHSIKSQVYNKYLQKISYNNIQKTINQTINMLVTNSFFNIFIAHYNKNMK